MKRQQVCRFEIERIGILDTGDRVCIQMPGRARLLHAGVSRGSLCIWALVDPDAKPTGQQFAVVGTGRDIPDMSGWYHVGTVLRGELEWHVFYCGPA